MQKLPIITKRHDVEIKSIGGQSIFNYFKQIQKIINSEYPNEKIDEIISEPVFSETQDEIHWYTFLKGDIKSFVELTQEEKLHIQNQLKLFQEKINGLIVKISKIDGETSSGPQALKYLLVCPNIEESLFSINGRVQITQWGCVPFGKNPIDYNIVFSIKSIIDKTEQEIPKLKQPPAQSPGPSTLNGPEPTIDPNDRKPEISSVSSEPDTINDVQSDDIPWRTLLIILLLLLLLLLLFYSVYDYYRVSNLRNQETNISQLTQELQRKLDNCYLKICQPPLKTEIEALKPDAQTRRGQVGVAVGKKLNVSLIWDAPVDLDLILMEPDDNLIYFRQKFSPNGGRLDIDQNARDLSNNPIENISYDQINMSGKYEVRVLLFQYHTFPENEKIDFKVEITEGQNTEVINKTFPPNSRGKEILVKTLVK